jgi:ADP-ribosylglycohydrolase
VNFDYEELKKSYYFNELCQTTVRQAICCCVISKNYEDCIRTCVSIGGDTDTVCAIAGGIAEAYYKKITPTLVLDVMKLLDERQSKIVDRFIEKSDKLNKGE